MTGAFFRAKRSLETRSCQITKITNQPAGEQGKRAKVAPAHAQDKTKMFKQCFFETLQSSKMFSLRINNEPQKIKQKRTFDYSLDLREKLFVHLLSTPVYVYFHSWVLRSSDV